MGKRIGYIDIARFIAIMAIVLCHACRGEYISVFLFSFQVPVFFFLSGMTFRTYDSFTTFFKKKVKSILVPYWSVGILCIIIYALLGSLVGNSLGVASEAIKADELIPTVLHTLVYGTSKTGYLKWNTPLWFLPCLFALQMVGYLIEKVAGDDKVKRIVLALILTAVGYGIITFLPQLYLPYQLETALNMTMFFTLGYLARSINLEKNRQYLVLVICLFINVALCRYNPAISVRLDHYYNYPVFLLNALSGIGWVMALSMIIGHNETMEYVGRNSLVILLWHKMPLLVMQIIANKLFGQGIVNTLPGYLYVICATAITVAGCLILDEIYRRITER